MPINVAIVEDDARVRESLAVLINGAEGFGCIGTFPNAETTLNELPSRWPDVLLVDINLPRMSGIQCVAKLKELKPDLQVLMLTAHMDNDQIFNSLQAGASGYLIKKTAPAKILEAIADVHSGGAPMSNVIARKVVQHFQQGKAADETKNLSAREYEILSHLAQGRQYKEIGDKLGISALTVRSHIRRIYEKLQVHSRMEAVLKFLRKESGAPNS